MGLLQTIKSLLGLDGTRSAASGGANGEQDVDVTVEREPSTESEDAVKGTETASTPPETDVSDVDEEPAASTTADAVTPDEGDSVTEPDAEEEPAGESDAGDEPAAGPDIDFEGADDPVTEIKGIGPAYADRLAGLDIETVGDLAVADAAEVAARTDLAETRVAGWIERANDY
ncbi:helix-hairpin-helix domain-containing protein [Halomicroarcula sp. GCM10025817]|uniref:helix-hairpin-helix domain-containing protein n=1 Tax=Haloarcula TaxID=2237 RepID=UPI0023E8D201|nr:helix-hairpin-helix domain-containing protein [Halomicroarcula sp. SYNS111]